MNSSIGDDIIKPLLKIDSQGGKSFSA